MAHVAEWKKEEVKELKSIIDQYDVVGLVDLENIPAKQLQEMRKSLKGKAVVRMSKINLINLALDLWSIWVASAITSFPSDKAATMRLI